MRVGIEPRSRDCDHTVAIKTALWARHLIGASTFESYRQVVTTGGSLTRRPKSFKTLVFVVSLASIERNAQISHVGKIFGWQNAQKSLIAANLFYFFSVRKIGQLNQQLEVFV